MTRIKKFFTITFLVIMVLTPIFANAAIIPCGGWEYDESGNPTTKQPECDFNMLMQLVNNIIRWIIVISIPVAAGVFAWAGFNMMINASNPGKRKDSIEMMKKVFIGFVVILSAWIIVTTITNNLLDDDFKKIETVRVEGVK